MRPPRLLAADKARVGEEARRKHLALGLVQRRHRRRNQDGRRALLDLLLIHKAVEPRRYFFVVALPHHALRKLFHRRQLQVKRLPAVGALLWPKVLDILLVTPEPMLENEPAVLSSCVCEESLQILQTRRDASVTRQHIFTRLAAGFV